MACLTHLGLTLTFLIILLGAYPSLAMHFSKETKTKTKNNNPVHKPDQNSGNINGYINVEGSIFFCEDPSLDKE